MHCWGWAGMFRSLLWNTKRSTPSSRLLQKGLGPFYPLLDRENKRERERERERDPSMSQTFMNNNHDPWMVCDPSQFPKGTLLCIMWFTPLLLHTTQQAPCNRAMASCLYQISPCLLAATSCLFSCSTGWCSERATVLAPMRAMLWSARRPFTCLPAPSRRCLFPRRGLQVLRTTSFRQPDQEYVCMYVWYHHMLRGFQAAAGPFFLAYFYFYLNRMFTMLVIVE